MTDHQALRVALVAIKTLLESPLIRSPAFRVELAQALEQLKLVQGTTPLSQTTDKMTGRI